LRIIIVLENVKKSFFAIIKSHWSGIFANVFFFLCNFSRKKLYRIKKIWGKNAVENLRCVHIAGVLTLIRKYIAGESRQLTETRFEMREQCWREMTNSRLEWFIVHPSTSGRATRASYDYTCVRESPLRIRICTESR